MSNFQDRLCEQYPSGYADENMLQDALGSLTTYLCTRKAAAYLGISEKSLRNMCSNGSVKYYKLNHRNRFLISDLNALVTSAEKGR